MDESKYIIVKDNGYVWRFPARLIAKNRADYYASKESEDNRLNTYNEEFIFIMKDDYELRDWFLNNMDWKDVSKSARLIEQPFLVVPDLSKEEVQSSIQVVLVDI